MSTVGSPAAGRFALTLIGAPMAGARLALGTYATRKEAERAERMRYKAGIAALFCILIVLM